MENPTLNLLLRVLRILLDFCSNASHKSGRFFEALQEKKFEFVPNRRNGTIAFNLIFVLLPAKVNFILKKRGHKKDLLGAYASGRLEIIFALFTKVIALYVGGTIV